MPLSLKCRVCGRVITERYPILFLTWLLSIVAFIFILIIPFLVGFSTVQGGLAIIVGAFAALVVLYLFVRAEDTCQECKVSAGGKKNT